MASLVVLHERTCGVDDSEFETWARTIQPQLSRFAEMLVDSATAQDVVAETMITLWSRNLPYPATEDAASPLRSLAFKVLLGHVQNERRRHARSQSLIGRISRLDATPETVPDSHDGVASEHAYRHLIERLPPDDQSLVLLSVAGFTPDESADILGCSPAAFYKRRERATSRLRAIIEKERGTT